MRSPSIQISKYAIERTNDIKLSDLTEINTESVQIMQNRAIAFSSRY